MPAFPTIDVTCDRKLRTIPLTRSQASEDAAVTTYEVPQDIVEAILKAGECRLFVPGAVVSLPREQLWKAWADPSKGAEAPKGTDAVRVGWLEPRGSMRWREHDGYCKSRRLK